MTDIRLPDGRWVAFSSLTAQVAAGSSFAAVNAASGSAQGAGGGGAHNNMPPYTAVNVFIKT